MAPAKTAKTENKPKKEKVFHPQSRKAGQISRSHFRKGKLSEAASKRNKKQLAQADVYGFFYHAIPPEGVLTLEHLHSIVRDIWLVRHDVELEQERAARRKGRPKSTKEMKLEEIKLREAEEYRTGMEVPDLTHEPTVELYRRWDQKEVAFIYLLRFVRISGTEPTLAILSRPGTHHTVLDKSSEDQLQNQTPEMDTAVDDSMLSEPPTRFASTIMAMDGPL